MKLGKVQFPGFVFGQSGVQGFFGDPDEYPHHKWYRLIPGFSFKGIVFVAKTATIEPRVYPESSNTELKDEYKVKRLFPKSIWWSLYSFIHGYLLNAVGLANPGFRRLVELSKYQQRQGNFQLSFMPMATTLEGKLAEAHEYCDILLRNMPPTLSRDYGIQLNLSCPNTGHISQGTQDASEAIAILKVFREKLPGVPLIPKFDLLIEPAAIIDLKPYADAFMIGNTLAFGKKSGPIQWHELFKDGTSPLLKHFGGKFSGGLSGAPLFLVLLNWLKRMQSWDPSVVIIAGGGIMTKADIKELSEFSIVKGVALGSVAILRPWRLQGLIQYGNKIFNERQNKI